MEEDLEPEDSIIEEREELMVPPSGGNPTRRHAHFLKPSVTSIKGLVFKLPSGSPTSTTTPSVTDLPLKVEFRGRRGPLQTWKSWFDRMHSLHQSTWKKAGIYEAILSSTYQIRIDKEIVLGFAGKWRYSVLGDSVLRPLETRESDEIHEKLMKGRSEVIRSKARKADQHEWVRLFMGSGSEIEHEAFLVLWLSRHVFPYALDLISKNVLKIAIHLARGTRIALAPAVLRALSRLEAVEKCNLF
ncbi:hypothetical protein C3L33_10356, partial [Rhododendron williamsianum]